MIMRKFQMIISMVADKKDKDASKRIFRLKFLLKINNILKTKILSCNYDMKNGLK